MATSVVTLQRYIRGWIARKQKETMKNKQENNKINARNKALTQQKDIEKDRNVTTEQDNTSPDQISPLGTPWGNVKMRRKFFSELEEKDEAATIIQSRKTKIHVVIVINTTWSRWLTPSQ